MLKLAVVGKDVSKSVSPQMHTFIASRLGTEISYEKLSVAESDFEGVIEDLLDSYDGLNFTIPYKLSVIPYLKKIVGDAKSFGAVNTVITATRTGYNTDGLGFMQMLEAEGVKADGKRVLLLGAGGAGRSVAKKLTEGGATLEIYDRFAESAESVARECGGSVTKEIVPEERDIIINATGVGMHKTVGLSPVGEDVLKRCAVACDLIYTPPKSEFLRIAEINGKKIINGLAMLFYQAYYAECYYLGAEPNAELAEKLFGEYKEVYGL